MKKITIFYDRQGTYTLRWLKPMLATRKEFESLGYKVELSSFADYFPMGRFEGYLRSEMKEINQAMRKNHDIVFLAFHHSTSYLGTCPKEERISILKEIKSHCNTLVWLDTADSTGTCLFDVLPFVDLYFKKQILKNTDDYCRKVWGGRTFCEFYHNILGIGDDEVTDRDFMPAEKGQLHKLRLSWNVGLGDLFVTKPYQIYLRPNGIKQPEFIDCDKERILDLQYRGSGYSPIAGYPRSRSKELLAQIDGIKMCDITRKIPKTEYIIEGQNSKSILSPFGWGEICGRDFEAIVYGATMIKQSMEHCITYPNVYQPMETYVPLKWDFSDFEEVIKQSASSEYRKIARHAQEYYKHFFTNDGRLDFAKHIVNELERK